MICFFRKRLVIMMILTKLLLKACHITIKKHIVGDWKLVKEDEVGN